MADHSRSLFSIASWALLRVSWPLLVLTLAVGLGKNTGVSSNASGSPLWVYAPWYVYVLRYPRGSIVHRMLSFMTFSMGTHGLQPGSTSTLFRQTFFTDARFISGLARVGVT